MTTSEWARMQQHADAGEAPTRVRARAHQWRRLPRGPLAPGWRHAQCAVEALDDLIDLPIERAVHTPVRERCWQLRAAVTPYDAAHVALAELLDVALVTSDHRLADAPGPRCTIELLTSS